MNTTVNNDPCLDCGTPTLGVITMDNGATYGIGINRLFCDEGDREGYRCGECAGYECDACGKNIYLDMDIQIETENYGNEFYHEECLTLELRLIAIEQGSLEDLCEICESNPKETSEGKWCTSCKDDFKKSEGNM
jgi:hypothetical protein